MKCPAEIYSASCRPYRGIPEPHYPFRDRTVMVVLAYTPLSFIIPTTRK